MNTQSKPPSGRFLERCELALAIFVVAITSIGSFVRSPISFLRDLREERERARHDREQAKRAPAPADRASTPLRVAIIAAALLCLLVGLGLFLFVRGSMRTDAGLGILIGVGGIACMAGFVALMKWWERLT